jgi:hypothetical protein
MKMGKSKSTVVNKTKAPRRRLSNGSSLVEYNDNDQEGAELEKISNSGFNSISSKKRSSFGAALGIKSPTLNLEEQMRITEMYKKVIQLSSENVRFKYKYLINLLIFVPYTFLCRN